MTNKSRFGVDIGGVLIGRHNDRTDTSFFGPNYLQSEAVAEALQSLRQLSQAGWEVHLVSKCGDNVERKTREWLRHHDFYQLTGVVPEHVHFCRTRPEKEPICRRLGVEYFVDDRLDVLDHLVSVPQLVLFQPNPADEARFQQGHRARLCQSWPEVLALL